MGHSDRNENRRRLAVWEQVLTLHEGPPVTFTGRRGRRYVTVEITGKIHQRGVALFRIAVGIIFLWAGLEKLLGPEPFDAAGFLKFGTLGSLGWPFVSGTPVEGTVYNPTHDFWVALAGYPGLMSLINVLVVAGEIGIGIALIIGLFTRFAGAMGTLMMLLFFLATWNFAYGIVNQQLSYALICATLTGIGAGKYYGLDSVLAHRFPAGFRKYVMSGEPKAAPRPATDPVPVTA
jgi:thiosulfate dehydrogenase [quinone] large subunit